MAPAGPETLPGCLRMTPSSAPLQTANFWFVPVGLQPLAVNIVNVFWKVRLSSISTASRLHLGCTSAYLGCTSAAPRLHLGCTSAAPRLYLGCTSAAPRLHLGCTSAIIARAARRRAGHIHLPTAAHRREVAPSARRGADKVRLARRYRAAGKTRPLPGDGLAPQGLGGAHVRRRQTGGRAAGPGAVRGRDSRPPRACRGRGSTLRARGLSHAAASPPCLDPSEPSLGRVSTCLGYISDTSNPATLFRVPLDCKVSRCRCVYVEGAGHAGATDDRLDLRAELAAWRREVIEVSRKEPTTAATV